MSTDPSPPAEDGDGAPAPYAIAATDEPIPLDVRLIEDERVPEEMVCMGTYRNGRLVARVVMPPEAWQQIREYALFEQPVQVVLIAREASPGLQCQLYALVNATAVEDESEAAEEPWAESVPGAGYEASVADAESADDEADQLTPIPLGNIVRFARDRVHPDSLPMEAADVLMKVIEGKTAEMVDRALRDLFE